MSFSDALRAFRPTTTPEACRASGPRELADGGVVIMLVKTSGRDGFAEYQLTRVGDVYGCTCSRWRAQKGARRTRTCKHLAQFRGVNEEAVRVSAALLLGRAAASTKLRFRDLGEGDEFEFVGMEYTNGLARGPWVKTGPAEYVKSGSLHEPPQRVGSVNVEVVRPA